MPNPTYWANARWLLLLLKCMDMLTQAILGQRILFGLCEKMLLCRKLPKGVCNGFNGYVLEDSGYILL